MTWIILLADEWLYNPIVDMFQTANLPPLIDRYGRKHTYLRVSVTDRCNFRCTYCMPPDGVEWQPRSEILTFEEIVRLVKLFARMGVDKVRLTGGEPTVRKGIKGLIRTIAETDGIKDVLITTNGSTLAVQAAEFKSAGLTGINVSLDSLQRKKFVEITRRDHFDQVIAGIDAAIAVGFDRLKINVVLMEGVNDDEIVDFVRRFAEFPVEVRFIEFMPFQENGWEQGRMVPSAEVRRRIGEHFSIRPIDTEPCAVATEYSVDGSPLRLGFISSMTESFCSGCNRVRLTADGMFKVCLFAAATTNLRDPMREGSDDGIIEERIRGALAGKWAGHPPMDQLLRFNDRAMIGIGG